MTTTATDDFSAFAGSEHMFFGLVEPLAMIREETEQGLRGQVPDTVLESLVTRGQPKFLTIGKKTTPDSSQVIVAHFGFSVQAHLTVTYDGGRERAEIEAALTFLFGNVDRPESQQSRTHFDLNDDAARNFTDELFKDRFLAFRAGLQP